MVARVRGPTLPTNIVAEIMTLLHSESSGVIPVENPVVANPLTTSNSICSNVNSGSSIHTANVLSIIARSARLDTMNAFITDDSGS